jgi:hypothetical protein
MGATARVFRFKPCRALPSEPIHTKSRHAKGTGEGTILLRCSLIISLGRCLCLLSRNSDTRHKANERSRQNAATFPRSNSNAYRRHEAHLQSVEAITQFKQINVSLLLCSLLPVAPKQKKRANATVLTNRGLINVHRLTTSE